MKFSDRLFDFQPKTVTKDLPLHVMKVSHEARDKFIYGSCAYGYTFLVYIMSIGLTRALQMFSPRIRLRPDERKYGNEASACKEDDNLFIK
jgi:hypothetical protein